MPVTPIEARCRRCGRNFHLFEVREQGTGKCPRCGWMLTPDWTAKLLEDAANADLAQRQLVAALRGLRNLPGNVILRPQSVLRNLFKEVGWDKELAEDPQFLGDELHELRRLLAAWEVLDPEVAAARRPRSRFRRLVAAITGTPPEPAPLSAHWRVVSTNGSRVWGERDARKGWSLTIQGLAQHPHVGPRPSAPRSPAERGCGPVATPR
jgi:ribosomal protein L37E